MNINKNKSFDKAHAPNVEKSVDGYILCITGLHEETCEDELNDEFSEFGKIRNLHMNLDR